MKKTYTAFLIGTVLLLTGCSALESSPGERQIEEYYSQQNVEIVSTEYAEHADGYIAKVNGTDYFFVSKDGDRFSEVPRDSYVLVGLGFTEEVPE